MSDAYSAITPLTEAERRGIQASVDRWARALHKRDGATLATLYTEDAVLLPAHAPAQHGRAALRAFLEAFPTLTSHSIVVEEIVGSGDLAYVRGTYQLSIHVPGVPAPIKDHGKFIEIRRRGAGDWLIARDIFNSDVPAR